MRSSEAKLESEAMKNMVQDSFRWVASKPATHGNGRSDPLASQPTFTQAT